MHPASLSHWIKSIERFRTATGLGNTIQQVAELLWLGRLKQRTWHGKTRNGKPTPFHLPSCALYLSYRPSPRSTVNVLKHNWPTCRGHQTVSITPLPSRLRDLCARGSRKIVRIRDSGALQEKSVFQTQQCWYIYELTESSRAQRRPTYTHSKQHPNIEKGSSLGWQAVGPVLCDK